MAPNWFRKCTFPAAAADHCSAPRLGLALLLVSCIILVGLNFDASKVEALLLWVQENKSQGSLLFFALYTAGVVLMLPAMVMAMASGAIFGMVYGAFLAWLGSSIGQIIAFGIGRYLLRELVLGYLTRQFPKWTAIDRALITDGWKLVTLLRLSPIAPWNILNYALSVTSVPLHAYALASSLAILPYLLLFVYFGSLARNLADIFTGAAGLDTNTTIVMGIISGVAMVGIVWYTTHISRRAVNDALREHTGELPPELTRDADVVTLLGGPEIGGEGGNGNGAPAPMVGVIDLEMAEFSSNAARGRRSALSSPNAASGSAVGEETSLLGKEKKGGGGGGNGGNLHSRSTHASPRALSPNGSARRPRPSVFS